MKFAYTAYAAVALLALAASASADCENIDYSSIDGFHFGNGVGEIVEYAQFLQYYNSTAGEWMSYIGGPPELESFFSEVSVVFSAIEGTPFFTPSWHSDHADLDGDGVIEGLPGPISPELEEVLYAPPDPETGIALGIPFAYNELCMWSESGAGPTGYSFICADQDDSEFYTSYILDCDENGKITKIRSEGLEPKNNAADQLATDILGDGFLHASGPARIWYGTIIGG